jgi:outer membrane receptor for Fe3+-dicitrate
MKALAWSLSICFLAPLQSSFAQESATRLEAVRIEDSSDSDFGSESTPRDSDRPVLLRGKKVTQVKLDALPELSTNNHRQAFTKVPGLLVSEVSNESFASFNYRGQGDPHETLNLLLLQDGAPIAADLYGYPANYYIPPYDWVEGVEFLRGGAGLIYGPQPGGALNYRLKKPEPRESIGGSLGVRFGSNRFQAYNGDLRFSLGGTDALLLGQRRLGEGFRTSNSDFNVGAAMARTETKLTDGGVLRVEMEHYQAEFGEPGGLAVTPGANRVAFSENRFASTLQHDRLQIRRTGGSVGHSKKLDGGGLWESRLSVHSMDRDSFRQASGTAPAFGGVANGGTNTIQQQGFTTASLDSRVKFKPELFGIRNTATVGGTLYYVDSPFLQSTGNAPNARSGDLKKDLMRNSRVVSIFLEDRLEWGSFSLTPGVRIENIYQKIRENLNVGSVAPLRSGSEWLHVPLFGLGMGYAFEDGTEWYANVSQAYKPPTYQDTIPLFNNEQVASDIDESRSIQAETGYRGRSSWLQWDSSLFYIRYTNQFGRVGSLIQNTGGARYFGWDGSLEADLGHWVSALRKVHLYTNFSALNASFFEGSLAGKTPQYAPKYLIRSGVLAYPVDGTKIALMNTFVTDHFADDGNTTNFQVPTYRVWDLTFETRILDTRFQLVGGVNNLFDSAYWTRVRSNGIDPALPRNFYLGLNARI